MKINTNKLLRGDRSLMLACDQGLEHGPQDFNLKNLDPQYILDIALEQRYSAVILQAGLAEKYYHEAYKDVPLVAKINGKTSLLSGEPYSPQLCSVDRAIKIGADAIGYTLFPGSAREADIFQNFTSVVERAHDYGIPVIAWMYPRGKAIKNDIDTNILAYAARIGLELGADFLKLKYNHDPEGFKWVVKNAGRARVLAAGGDKQSPQDFLHTSKEMLSTGITGFAVGRNVWQDENPHGVSKALNDLVFHNKEVQDVLHHINK